MVVLNMQTQHIEESRAPSLSATRSTRLDGGPEDIRIFALVVSELKLVNVQMQVLLADFVEGSDNSTLHDRPKTFDRVGMNGAADIFPISMTDQAYDSRNGHLSKAS